MNQDLHKARYMSLATFRRDGNAVRTPVWFASRDESLYVFSAGAAGKVKRVRNFSRVEVATCNARGSGLGDWHQAEAFLVDDQQECKSAYSALRKKYGIQMLTLDFFSGLSGKINERQIIRIDLPEE